MADANRIVQAVGNLVANAVTHGDAERPITVRSEGSGGRLRVSVHNHGRAIPPELLPRLFEPMVRGAEPAGAGVGLGLYIVREIVRAHGGTVAVQSDASEGTTVVLDWPCA